MQSSHMKWFSCHLCTYKSCNRFAVKQHVRKEHNEELLQPWAPNTCTQQVPVSFHGDYNVSCDVCNQEFPDRDTLENHIESSHLKWFSCHLCKFKSRKINALEQHIIRKHKKVSVQHQLSNRFKTGLPGTVTAIGSARCIPCIHKTEFSDWGTLKIHMESHE